MSNRIGPNGVLTDYTVNRTPRQAPVERQAPGLDRGQGFDPPERPAHTPDVTAVSR